MFDNFSSTPSIILSNARSILPKFDELCALVSAERPDVIGISETWLTDAIDSSLISMPGFTLFRDDRLLRKGGGTCLWARDSLDPRRIMFQNKPQTIEATCITMRRHTLLCICVYIPPSLIRDDKDAILNYLTISTDEYLASHQNANVIIMGDFNDFDVEELSSALGLINVVADPTRNDSRLDHILLSDDLLCKYTIPAIVGPPLSTSDHNCVLLRSQCILLDTGRTATVYDLRRSNKIKYVHAFIWT